MLICPICPICLAALSFDESNNASCPQNHHFDRARQGYFNLLPVQHKNSRAPGDNTEMVTARREFLEEKHYAPLAKKLAELVAQHSINTWLDVGCGEGYYTMELAKALPNALGYGLDISKEAIKQACKKTSQLQWLVASMARIPLADKSCDLIASIFSPFNWDEALRVLSDQGGILRLGPSSNHLIELREKLYDEVRHYQDDKHLLQVPEGLTLAYSDFLEFPLTLSKAQDRQNLLAMTPHGWRASVEKRQAVINAPLTVTVAVRYDYFKRI